MNHGDTKLTGPEIFHSLHVYADRFEELGWNKLAKAQPRVLVFLKEVTYEGDSRGYTQLVIKGVAPQE